jgi:guanine deaminase
LERLALLRSDSDAQAMEPGTDESLLREALELAIQSAAQGGGPFGAVVARDGRALARGTNRVVLDRDPTAHAEIAALRAAARALGTHDLSGCTLYSSCEPCPMCWGALRWARVDALVFAAGRDAAAAAGFDDRRFHDELALPTGERALEVRQRLEQEGREPFAAWLRNEQRTPY